MSHHVRTIRWGLRCSECFGRSFSDPTKEFHYPECSLYREWRFGPKAEPAHYPDAEQVQHEQLRDPCHHGTDFFACPTCNYDGSRVPLSWTGRRYKHWTEEDF